MKPSVVNLGKNERYLTVRELADRIANCTTPQSPSNDLNELPHRYLSRYCTALEYEREHRARILAKTLERIAEIIGAPTELDTPLELAVLASYECRHDDVVFSQAKRYEGHKTLYEHALENVVSEYERVEHGRTTAAIKDHDTPANRELTDASASPDAASDDVSSAGDDGNHEIAPPLTAAAVEAMSIRVTTHRLKAKRHALDHVLSEAKRAASEPENYHSVWSELVRLAERDTPPAPLICHVDAEGIKYQASSGIKFFTKDALRKQMNPRAR